MYMYKVACAQRRAYHHHRARIKSLPYFMDDSAQDVYLLLSTSPCQSLTDRLSAVLPTLAYKLARTLF